MTVEGLDVSAWQDDIDWAQVPATYRFVAIKASEGTYGRDPKFPRNWEGARLTGRYRLAYHYFIPGMDGAAQADFLHRYVRENGHFDAGGKRRPPDGVMLDLEAPLAGVAPALAVSRAEAFVQRILSQTHCGVFLYVGFYYYRDVLGNPRSEILHRCPLWLPDYGPQLMPVREIGWESVSCWQYSETGVVPGIGGYVDLDTFEGTEAELRMLLALGGRK